MGGTGPYNHLVAHGAALTHGQRQRGGALRLQQIGSVGLWWVAAVASGGGFEDEDLGGSGSWGPSPAPAPPLPWYHCGSENGSAACLAGRVPDQGAGKSYRTENCDHECSMYKCSGRGSNIQCSPNPFGTYAPITYCVTASRKAPPPPLPVLLHSHNTENPCGEQGCHLYRCDGSQCIQDDDHGTYFAEVRPPPPPSTTPSLPLCCPLSVRCRASSLLFRP